MNRSPFEPENQNSRVEARIVAALERIAQAFRVLLWNEGKMAGLSPIQIQLLIFLHFQPGSRKNVSELARVFDLTKPTISDSVKALEEKKLIRRVKSTSDGRSHSLQLSTKGKAVAENASFFAAELQKPINGLSRTEKENLLLSLLDIIHHLNQQHVITLQRMCYSCSHYRTGIRGATHFCALLNAPLQADELRLDCAEYEAKS